MKLLAIIGVHSKHDDGTYEMQVAAVNVSDREALHVLDPVKIDERTARDVQRAIDMARRIRGAD